jgi:hypothetical protein
MGGGTVLHAFFVYLTLFVHIPRPYALGVLHITLLGCTEGAADDIRCKHAAVAVVPSDLVAVVALLLSVGLVNTISTTRFLRFFACIATSIIVDEIAIIAIFFWGICHAVTAGGGCHIAVFRAASIVSPIATRIHGTCFSRVPETKCPSMLNFSRIHHLHRQKTVSN